MPDVSCERVEQPARIEAQRASYFSRGRGRGRRVKAPPGENRSVLTVLSSTALFTRQNPSVNEKEACENPFHARKMTANSFRKKLTQPLQIMWDMEV